LIARFLEMSRRRSSAIFLLIGDPFIDQLSSDTGRDILANG
jgi:hypothetical protein